MKKKTKITAIIVAAGDGSRMNSSQRKPFMELEGLPMLVHTLRAFEHHPLISSIVLVLKEEDLDRGLDLCVRYGIKKIREIVQGGPKRFRSVLNGLKAVEYDTDFVMIHDGARPLVSAELISSIAESVPAVDACTAAVPVKDTIKMADREGYAQQTLDRSRLWAVQTPQAFSYPLLIEAYEKLLRTIEEYQADESAITDDAVIVENMTDCRVRFITGEYSNIKVTTPEDLIIAEALLRARES